MHEKMFLQVLSFAGCIAMLCSCTPVSPTQPPDANDSPSSIPTEASNVASVTIDDIISTQIPPQFAGMEVIEDTSLVDWGIYPFPENMISLSDAIVYGTVTDKQYINFSEDAWTEFHFTVEQTLQGNVSTDAALTIYSSGGYITQYDQFTAQGMRERITDRTDAQLQNTIVHQHANYHFDPLVEKKYILFLTQTDSDSILPQDTYQIVGAKYCQLCETAPDTFSYIAFGPDPENPDAVFSPDDPVVQMTRKEMESLVSTESENTKRKVLS